MEKNSWKELAIFLLMLWAIYIVIQFTAPFLALSFWDAFRNLFGLGIITSWRALVWTNACLLY